MDVSIGICAYNEQDNIGNLLEDLFRQYLPGMFRVEEIIVVSSGSTDRTNEIVSKMAERERCLKLIKEEERKGKSHGLNVLFDHAKGDIVVIVSADTKPTTDSLAKLLKSIKPDIGGACARTLPMNCNGTLMEFCYWFLWKIHNRFLQEEVKDGTLSHLGGDLWAIRNGIVRYIPREVINDDAYLGIALKKKGWRIAYASDAEVFIHSPTTPLDYIRQRERIVIGHKQIEQITGMTPTTIGALLFKKPLLSLEILVKEIKVHKVTDYPKIVVGIFLEFMAQALARKNFKKRTKYIKWRQIRGTKNFTFHQSI